MAALAEGRAKNAGLTERVAVLEAQLAKLLERLGENSISSNKPPSSAPPSARKKPKKKPGGGWKGGEKDHRGAHRRLLAPDQVDELIDIFPSECEHCRGPLPQLLDGTWGGASGGQHDLC